VQCYRIELLVLNVTVQRRNFVTYPFAHLIEVKPQMLIYHRACKLVIAIALTGTTLSLFATKATAQIFSDAGFLNVGDIVEHTFQGNVGKEVTISVESTDLVSIASSTVNIHIY
jgi:hypothetical protein